jgi:Spy/CpxP family protein refolding chaperone
MMSWWRGGRAEGPGGCGPNPWAAYAASCGPRGGGPGWHGGGHGGGDDGGDGGDGEGFGGGGFGVRRPLRFLAHKLDLDDRQVGELAKILDELKTERAQAEVDRRRTLSAFADAVGGEAFNQARASEGAGLRVSSAERLRDAVTKALAQIHALLDNDQRERLAYLIRTGTLVI